MFRVIVAIELVTGPRSQAVCRTPGCTAGPGGRPWTGEPRATLPPAQDDASRHRQWHRHRPEVAA